MEDEFDIVYRQLFRKYYANLLFYAARMVGEEDAEDVVQEVFVELWHRKDSVTVGEQIQAFLYRAVYTRALNVLKHRDIKNSYEAAMQEVYNKRALFYQPDDNDVLKRIEDRELRKHIISAIDELPEKCKLVFKLSYLHNMKNKDIAEAMDVSLRTVEAHMYNIRTVNPEIRTSLLIRKVLKYGGMWQIRWMKPVNGKHRITSDNPF